MPDTNLNATLDGNDNIWPGTSGADNSGNDIVLALGGNDVVDGERHAYWGFQ